MKLEPKTISQLVHNTLSYTFGENDDLHFYRFTQTQRQTYKQESPEWEMKCDASASVTLDFVPDSDYIALKFDLRPGSSQRWCSIDLYVDGVFWDHRYAGDLSVTLAAFPLPAGDHRVTVYFPWSAQTVVKEVRLSDGARVTPIGARQKMLFLGDSITQGYLSRFASMSYVNQVARILDMEAVNQGIGGYYFNDATIDETLLAYQPDIILVAYGTNDYSRYESLEDYAAHSGSYLQKLAALFPHTPILGILPLYRNDQNHQARKLYRSYSLDDARAVLRAQYEACGYALVQTGIPHVPQAYGPDFLHPNEFGFSVMAQGVSRKVQEILGK